jgi:predicted lipid-binding transport protein (Tim44 family)
MKKFLIVLMVALSAASIVVSEADAKRLGGGGSIGRQAPGMSRQAPAQPSQNQLNNANKAQPGAPAPATQPPPKPTSPWKGILGGALLGLGLGALLSHLGIGGALASVISTMLMIALLALVAMFIFRMFRRRSPEGNHGRPAYAGGYVPPVSAPEIGSRRESEMRPAALQANVPATMESKLPAEFDVQSFLRNAKTYFIRLQAAWDKADINDIREFSTPEMFAELRLQLQERGPNHTDVVSLDAELVGLEQSGNDYVASVRFSGMIKEADNAPAEPFTEIWHLTKPVSGQGGWVLAGIQQLS